MPDQNNMPNASGGQPYGSAAPASGAAASNQQPYAAQTAGQPYAQQPVSQQAQPYAAQPSQPYAAHTAQQPYAGAAYQQAYAAPYVPAAPAQKKGKGGWIAFGVILFAIVFMFTVGALSCSHTVARVTSGGGMLGSTSETIIAGDTVAVIDITGTIQYDGSACSPEGLSLLLAEAEDDPNIKAVVLRVDSGGGTSTAGEEMAAYVRDFSKPIVVSSASMNCSAAYEISSQADYIFVNKTTAIGAIGTALQLTDYSELLEKLGISVDNITSADSKDSSYGTRPLTQDEREYYQRIVDDINETFIETVAEGRDMDIEAVRALATGMEFTGMDAITNGLADEIGIYDDAIEKAAELGGITSDYYDVVNLTDTGTDLSLLMDLLSAQGQSSGLDLSSVSVEDLLTILNTKGAHE